MPQVLTGEFAFGELGHLIPSGGGAFDPSDLSNYAMDLDYSALGLSNGDLIATVEDLSNNNNDANQSNGTYKQTFRTNVINGKSVARPEGTASYMIAADASSLRPTTGFSIFMVIRTPGSFTASRTLWNKFDYNTQNAIAIQINSSSGDIIVYLASSLTDGAANHGVTATGVLAANTNYLLEFHYDGGGATNADKLHCVVNGVDKTFTWTGNAPTSIPNSSAPVGLGVLYSGGSPANSYSGIVDHGRTIYYTSVKTGTDRTNCRTFLNDLFGL